MFFPLRMVRLALAAVMALPCTLAAQATEFITDVMVIGARTEGQINLLKVTYESKGWTVIDNDLNKGCGGNSDYVYLLYKSEENTDGLNHGYITDFYISDATGTVADNLDYGNHTYYLVPFDGDNPQTIGMSTVGGEFKASKGDLNSGTSGVNIHLYYTREQFTDNRTASAIVFNDTKNESVVWNGNGEHADLNKGCGSGSAYIYMYVDTYASAFPGYIKDVMLIGGTGDEVNTLKTTLTAQGWKFINHDLNAGCGSSSDYIYLLYKSENSTDGYNYGYITDFYISNATGTPPDDLTYDGRTYHLVPFDGGSHFKEKRGDLNSNAGGDDIHLYYSKKPYVDGHTVTNITFNNIKAGAVGVNGSCTGYDLNNGCGSESAYIYMHLNTAKTLNNPEPFELTLSSGSDQKATLTWKAPVIDNIKGYTYQFKETSADEWSNEVNTTTTSATFSGLSPETSYVFRVKTRYGNNSESAYEIIDFTTARFSLPYTCGFENGMEGWRMVNAYTPNTNISVVYPHEGSHSFKFLNFQSESDPQYLISPRFSGVDALGVSFYYSMKWPTHQTFQIGYSTTTNAPTAFNWVETISPVQNEWHMYEHVFPKGTKYVAICYDNSNTSINSIYLDDFSFMAYSTYAKPTGLAANNLTDQSATMTWTAPENATPSGYAYQYKRIVDEEWSDVTEVHTTSVTLSGLPANTAYNFRVKSLYDGDHASNNVTVRFITEGPIESLPYEDSFENGMGGWRLVDDEKESGIKTETEFIHTGSCSFRFFRSPGDSDPQYLMSPQLDSGSDIIVSFWYVNVKSEGVLITSAYQVGYSANTKALDDFTWRDEIANLNDQWNYNITICPAGTKYVAIKFTKGMFLYLDDFRFEVYSTEAKPTGLAASNLTDQSATLTWTATNDATGYAYEFKKASETSWSATATVNTTSVTLSGLTDNTTYDFRVRALYSGNNASNNVNFQFLTEAAAVSLPYTDSFENGMGGWRLVDGYGATGIDMYMPHTGNNSFHFLWGSDAPTQYLMSPQINASSPIMVSFYYNNLSQKISGGYDCYKASFHVGYSITTKDPSEFTWGNEILSASPEWEQYAAVFPAGTKYVAIKWVKRNPLFLDDFLFEQVDYTLSSAEDWNKWAAAVANGTPTTGVEFTLADDIEVSTMMGTETNPFSGTFDGQGHMLTLSIDKTADGVAPFSNISGATIKNLKTAGTVNARGQYGSGLVAYVRGGTNQIENCVVASNVALALAYGGGIVSHLGSSATTTIDGCVFTGAISTLGTLGGMHAATLVGYAENGTTLTLKDCLDASTSTKPIGRGDPMVTLSNNYYTTKKVSDTGQNYWPDYYATYACSSATLPADIGSEGKDYGFVTAYGHGLKYDGKYYMKTAPEVLPGDVNGDGKVTPADAIMILYHYFNVVQNGFNVKAADLNNDGHVTPADAIEALYLYFGSSSKARATSPMVNSSCDPE
ncbi:MAG: fibronectin type III domain-containing protein [Prevotella sp.]|nr:fibronectin type III domain-containing protein [Prevotella sp.]